LGDRVDAIIPCLDPRISDEERENL